MTSDTQNAAPELKPCPFCGSNEIGHSFGVSRKTLCVVCMECAASGPFAEGDTEQPSVWEEAARLWDTRAKTDRLVAIDKGEG